MSSSTRGRRGPSIGTEKQVLSELDANVQDDGFTDEEDDEYPGIATKQIKKKHFIRASDEEEDGSYLSPLDHSDSDGEGNRGRKRVSKKAKDKATLKSPKAKLKQRRRRRSSARFLRLSGRFGHDAEDDDLQGGSKKNENLGAVYRQAIKMNAENKINAGNSWGLRLIENMDRFTYDDDNGDSSREIDDLNGSSKKRVNFTKASCTLDASVKIYGYRVDDVHLTSYKVLANLNRTDNGGGSKKNGQKASQEDGNDASGAGRKASARAGPTETLESNLANINMSKLESAPDIDPLFRKMSKAFDEGGAKGLLLNNLGVAGEGCRIEFDSKDDTVAESTSGKLSDAFDQHEDNPEKGDETTSFSNGDRQECDIDISCLGNVLSGLLSGSSMDSLQLVPQLKTLRADFAALESEGYVNKDAPENQSKRSGVTEEEEKEAEQCIHREALERSQRSVMNVSFAASLGGVQDEEDDNDESRYGSNDFGGDDDESGDGGGFSFQADMTRDSCWSQNSNPSESFARSSVKGRASTTMLLDALCSSDAFTQGGEYEYFSQSALEKISTGNQWAGSAHWKKTEKIRRKKAKQNTEKEKAKKKRSTKQQTFLDFSSKPHPFLEALLKKGAPKKGKSDALQLTQAMKKKQNNESNLLPPDAGIGIEQLSRLFMRPQASLFPANEDIRKSRKSVGFHDVEFQVFDEADASYDDGVDDGPGFNFAGTEDGNFGDADDYVVEDMEGIRKVEKINIGYATVAKKVDVKRLKKDLWAEVEAKVAGTHLDKSDLTTEETADESSHDAERAENSQTPQISFKDTVKELESSQSQSEVTVPFYFICILHLANEKGLKLHSTGPHLEDFAISRDDGSAPILGTLPTSTDIVAVQRVTRKKDVAPSYQEEDESSCDDDENFEE